MTRRTIGQAAREDVTGFQVYCWGQNKHGYPCRHAWKYGIAHAVALWGTARELKSLRFVCTRCGEREFKLYFYSPPIRGQGFMCALKHHEEMYRYRWHDLWRHYYNVHLV